MAEKHLKPGHAPLDMGVYGGGGVGRSSWMQSPSPLFPMPSSSPPSPCSCRGRRTEEREKHHFPLQTKQTHSGLKIQHEFVECRKDVWGQRELLDSSKRQDSPHHHRLTPTAKRVEKPSSLALQRVWLAAWPQTKCEV